MIKNDMNRVELTGCITTQAEMRVVPPAETLYLSFDLAVRGSWPDHTGATTQIEYRITCFAQGETAEKLLWISPGQRVRVFGGIDLLVGDWDDKRMAVGYTQAVRVRELLLEESFQRLREAENDEQ